MEGYGGTDAGSQVFAVGGVVLALNEVAQIHQLEMMCLRDELRKMNETTREDRWWRLSLTFIVSVRRLTRVAARPTVIANAEE